MPLAQIRFACKWSPPLAASGYALTRFVRRRSVCLFPSAFKQGNREIRHTTGTANSPASGPPCAGNRRILYSIAIGCCLSGQQTQPMLTCPLRYERSGQAQAYSHTTPAGGQVRNSESLGFPGIQAYFGAQSSGTTPTLVCLVPGIA